MKFMLMMNAPRGTGDYAINEWKPEKLKAHMEFMRNLNVELKAEGAFVSGEGLASPGQARIVRSTKVGGPPEISDGPFAESKEFLAGYWIVDVDSAEQAYAIAGRISVAPGPNGEPLGIPVEVRQVMTGLPY